MALILIDRQTIRTRCKDIAPVVYKVSTLKRAKREIRLSHYHNILMKVTHPKTTTDPKLYSNPNEFYTIPESAVQTHLKHITEFDKSEAIVPHGEVSKRLYLDIFKLRKFNLYGGRYIREGMTDEEEQKIAVAARRMGIGYEKAEAEVAATDEIRRFDLFGTATLDEIKRPKITSMPHNIGMKVVYKAPVGFAPDPAGTLNSEGNEKYYSYDGGWKDGMMHGHGFFLFDDGGTYFGEYKDNWPHGEGQSKYLTHVVDKLAHKHPVEHVRILRQIFDLFDLDGSGYISVEEMLVCMKTMNPKLTSLDARKKAMEEIMENDVNNDGTTSFAEFLAQSPLVRDIKKLQESLAVVTEFLTENTFTLAKEIEKMKLEIAAVRDPKIIPVTTAVEGPTTDEPLLVDSANSQHIPKEINNPTAFHDYTGQWAFGKYEGRGVQTSKRGHLYTGQFHRGKRHGEGKIVYKSGLVYEGSLLYGKPHGKGRMESNLTKFVYEGEFYEGSIQGSGTLITPPPESKRIVRYWKESEHPVLLPEAARIYLKEKEENDLLFQIQENNINGNLRAAALRNYIKAVRQDIQVEREREKKQAKKNAQEKMRLKLIQLKEAKLRALAGDEDGTTK